MAKVAESFAEFKWPWTEGEPDEEKLAKLIWNLRRSEESLQDQVKELNGKVDETQTKLDAAEASKSGTDEDGQQKIKDLTKQVRDLEEAKKDLETAKTDLETNGRPKDQLEIARMEIANDLGLTTRQAKRLTGETKDELLEDARAYAEENGIELLDDGDGDGEGGNGNGEPGGDKTPPQRTPVSNLRTGAGAGKVKVASNPAEAAKSLPPLWQ